jgi:hypothetical protein
MAVESLAEAQARRQRRVTVQRDVELSQPSVVRPFLRQTNLVADAKVRTGLPARCRRIATDVTMFKLNVLLVFCMYFCRSVVGFQCRALEGTFRRSRSYQLSLAAAASPERNDDESDLEASSAFGSGLPWSGFIPIQELSDMMRSLDDVIDDFMNKRMGNGEVFYGKRKYKPSMKDNTEGRYNGMGLTDKARIDAARQAKESVAARRRL